ncbi:response regulator transcription factor [Clostridium thermobutyricum]|uniref:Stage 0 sporulation protein A homolog n=1 Tax=Clostridium thermobutyricum DSM 4928 TaxID=1121339 RepID=A0A1V4SYE3_9CLOT|nr:response regulator transcription factor [Clostridium thermobutyricum]OPX49961.1 response regulator protein GraR [Clostridium thermobutyricum DSM 4928]
MSSKIFIIEDDEKIRNELTSFLKKYNYNVSFSIDFENIIEEIFKENPDIVLLDINLPYYDGYYICREIRRKSNIPIIIVTSRNSELDELMSMNLGADDFVTKPYNTQILLARIESVLRRTYSNIIKSELSCRDLKYSMEKSTAYYNSNSVELTKNENRILNELIKNKGNIVSRDNIIKALWQTNEFVDENTLTVNVNRLRKKLESIGASDYLKTKRGQGYVLA